MALTALTIGPVHTITQNVSYATPVRRTFVKTSAAVDISLDETTWVALTGANTLGVECPGAFIRCTTGNALVQFKAS
jgi:hypothetical protein